MKPCWALFTQFHLGRGVVSWLLQIFLTFFKTLEGKEVTVELKNDLAITGTLETVDQFLNFKLSNVTVVDQEKFPQLVSTRRGALPAACRPKQADRTPWRCCRQPLSRHNIPMNQRFRIIRRCLSRPFLFAEVSCATCTFRRQLSTLSFCKMRPGEKLWKHLSRLVKSEARPTSPLSKSRVLHSLVNVTVSNYIAERPSRRRLAICAGAMVLRGRLYN